MVITLGFSFLPPHFYTQAHSPLKERFTHTLRSCQHNHPNKNLLLLFFRVVLLVLMSPTSGASLKRGALLMCQPQSEPYAGLLETHQVVWQVCQWEVPALTWELLLENWKPSLLNWKMELKTAHQRRRWSKAPGPRVPAAGSARSPCLNVVLGTEWTSDIEKRCHLHHRCPQLPVTTSLYCVEDEAAVKSCHCFHCLGLMSISHPAADGWGHSLNVAALQVLFTHCVCACLCAQSHLILCNPSCSLSQTLYQHKSLPPCSYTHTHTHIYMHTHLPAFYLFVSFPLNQLWTGSFFMDLGPSCMLGKES